MDQYYITEENIKSEEAYRLINELSDALQDITGDSGRNSFNINDLDNPRALFVIARDVTGEALGCGAFKPFREDIAEVKRMYARHKAKGIGTQIISYLEERAKEFGYSRIWLETRVINKNAVTFYKNRGYHRIDNYGKYIGNDKAVCFEKILYDLR